MPSDLFFAVLILGEVIFSFSASMSFNDYSPPVRIFECVMIRFMCDRSQSVLGRE